MPGIPMLRALRPLHWSKNLLVFVPVALAHRLGDGVRLASAGLCFLSLCLAASGTYLVNDLLDLSHDRDHPIRRHRVIASGQISPVVAMIAAALLIGAAVWLAAASVHGLAPFVIAYMALSISYSMALKRLVFVDVLALAALYTIRILAGGAAAGVEVSNWLLAFSGFLFVSLALVKRYADLRMLTAAGHEGAAGRGYISGDEEILRSIGITSGNIAVLVFALYLNSTIVERLYHRPHLLWLVCPLLMYWVAHMWFLAHRGAIREDPMLIAAKDPQSYVVALLVVVLAVLAV